MAESVVTVRSAASLVGVYNRPETHARRAPTLLLVNSGLLTRIGPFRSYVDLARALAQLGYASFRVDLSGIGDSSRRSDQLPRDQQHLQDIDAVIDELSRTTGAEQFIVLGICTGADLAHKAMMHNRRIVGAVCIDGYCYRTWRYLAHKYLPKLVRLQSWRTLAKQIAGAQPREEAPPPELLYRWELPPKQQVAGDYREIIASGRHLLCIFSSSWPYNYAGQLADAFADIEFGQAIQVAWLPNTTHTFRHLDERHQLMTTVAGWLETLPDAGDR